MAKAPHNNPTIVGAGATVSGILGGTSSTPIADSYATKFLKLSPEDMEIVLTIAEEGETTLANLKSEQAKNITLTKEVDTEKAISSEFTHKVAVLEQQVELLRAQVGTSQQVTAQPITEDGFAGEIPVLDPQYTPPLWVKNLLHPLMTDDALPVVALAGPAGIGKTHGIEQWAGINKRRVVLLNCKGQDPFAFVESQELRDGQTIRKLGVLAEAVQSPNTIIILDEIDTAPAEFQSLLLGMLEVEAFRRRLTTQGNGVIRVAPGVRFVLTMNSIGMNCGSRHRGSVLPPIQNRVSGCAGWIAVPMPDEKDLSKLFVSKNPTMQIEFVAKVAKSVLSLIKLASEGVVDADVSIRTGLGVCKSIHRFGVRGAWNLALLDGIDDPTQKASAITAISTHFTGEFRPVG